jgi:hypothetical protein
MLDLLFSLAQDRWDFRNTAKISLHSVCGASERSPDSASNSLDQLKRSFFAQSVKKNDCDALIRLPE